MILSLINISIAARSNAVMDILTHHYFTSIFSEKNSKYWNPIISWKNKYVNGNVKEGRKQIKILGKYFNIHVAFTDGWHKHKSIMISNMCMALFSFTIDIMVWKQFVNVNSILLGLIYFIISGLLWNKVFMYYYTKKFRK